MPSRTLTTGPACRGRGRTRFAAWLSATLCMASPAGAMSLQGPISVVFSPDDSWLAAIVQATGDIHVDLAGTSWSAGASASLRASGDVVVDAGPSSWPVWDEVWAGEQPVAVEGDVWVAFAENSLVGELDVTAGRNLYVWNSQVSADVRIASGDVVLTSTRTLNDRGSQLTTGGGASLQIFPGGDISLGPQPPLTGGKVTIIPVPEAIGLLAGGLLPLAAFLRCPARPRAD